MTEAASLPASVNVFFSCGKFVAMSQCHSVIPRSSAAASSGASACAAAAAAAARIAETTDSGLALSRASWSGVRLL